MGILGIISTEVPMRTLLLAAAALACAGASAQVTIPNGRLLASNCFQCHGTNGKGPGFERLSDKSAAEIYEELLDYRRGDEGSGLMAKHAWGYTDSQLRALSQYLARQR
jgi:cytochrome subunit of sulfide dehydrogenase